MREQLGAGSSRKVLDVLLSFSEARPRASIADLAAELGMPLSSAYRYVALLRSVGLIEERERGVYSVTARVMGLARAAQLANDLGRLAQPGMQRIADEVDETVMLMERIGTSATCVAHIECRRPMRYTFRTGHQVPLGSGASGKLLLAALPAAQRPGDRDAELAEIAARGWAISHGEVEPGVWACSAAIRDGATIVAGLSVAGPAVRIDERRGERILARAREVADEIGVLLAGYRLSEDTSTPAAEGSSP